jgi:hypothetical protein
MANTVVVLARGDVVTRELGHRAGLRGDDPVQPRAANRTVGDEPFQLFTQVSQVKQPGLQPLPCLQADLCSCRSSDGVPTLRNTSTILILISYG